MNRLEAARRAAGPLLRNCIQTSFHDAGFTPGTEAVRAGVLAYLESRHYSPAALGSGRLRSAIAGWYSARGLPASAASVAVTPGTSIAYELLFRLNPRPVVLLPRPSYPLFADLARAAGKRLRYYQLIPESGFTVDVDSLQNALRDDVGWTVVISPGNPGGELRTPAERALIAEAAERAGSAIIHDSVFETWGPADSAAERFCAWPDSAPVCRLGGLSKAFAAPDIKLSWMLMSGMSPAFLERLEIALDAQLSVSALADAAALGLFADLPDLAPIHARVEANRRAVRELEPSLGPLRLQGAQAGIHFACLLSAKVPIDDEALAVELCRTMQIYCHPGYLYDFPAGRALVFSLLSHPEDLRAGLTAAADLVAAHGTPGTAGKHGTQA